MPKSVLPKAESEQASARVTVEMRSVLREGRSPFMWATAANLRSSSASSQNGFPTATRDVDGYGQKQQHYKRRLFACSKHAIDAPMLGALNKTRAPAPRNNPRGPALDASAKAFKNDGPSAPRCTCTLSLARSRGAVSHDARAPAPSAQGSAAAKDTVPEGRSCS